MSVIYVDVHFTRNLIVKINHVNPRLADATVGSNQKKVDKPVSARPDVTGSDNHVHISALSTNTQALSRNSEIVDAAKVAEIKQAISEGHFKVNPEVVADRLLETVRELIQSKQSTGNE